MTSGRFGSARSRSVRRIAGAAALALAVAALAAGHSAAGDPQFDHFATAFPLTGAHGRVPCESCHTGGRLAGTPRECAFCHLGSGSSARTRRPANHVPSSSDCDDCHTTVAWRDARFDHADARGSCASCHNGTLAEGKSASHLPTSSQCADCHGVLRWSPATFSHAGIESRCASCHDGRRAEGKSKDHLRTTARCEECHGTEVWATERFEHAEALGSCESCHDNRHAAGKPPGHIPTRQPCDDCHRTSGWTPVSF
jgi:hypothetical protein